MSEQSLPYTITFLGTGGARFMTISQLLASGGIWLSLGGTEILLDPGPGSIVQATRRRLHPEKLKAIIVSHRHLDHAADVNIMVEAMTQGGHRRGGRLFAPRDAIEDEPVIFNYLRQRLEKVDILTEGGSYHVDGVTFSTPVRHVHPVETYGLKFEAGGHHLAYIADTRYFEGLIEHYACELVIVNLVFLERRNPSDHPGMPLDHLAVPDVEHLLRGIRPRLAVLTHFGMGVWRTGPREVARGLSERTGCRVIAARDGMKIDLANLDATRG